MLKEEGSTSVLAGDSPAGAVVVKRMVMDRGTDFIRRWCRATRLERQWRGAALLLRHGFSVARPLALWRSRDARGRTVESLAMERLHGETVLRHMADRSLSREAEFALARVLGEQAARLAMLGLVNRDHKPSNLLVLEGGSVAILDTVAIRRGRKWPSLVHMLFALIVEPIGCGVNVPSALRLGTVRAAACAAGLKQQDVARLWREVRARLERHGDPRPRINPLTTRSGQN